MAKSLSEQLVGKGLVVRKMQTPLSAVDATRQITDINQVAEDPPPRFIETAELDEAPDIYAFGEIAKILLSRVPSLMPMVFQKASRFLPDDYTENSYDWRYRYRRCMHDETVIDFYWRMHGLRAILPRCPEAKRPTLLNRAFRRHDPKVEIPE